jgi:hypothetical protein
MAAIKRVLNLTTTRLLVKYAPAGGIVPDE